MAYIPDRGDAVWISFNPQAGHEQAGHRPAVVLSPRAYNQKSGLALFCPITSRIKGYPFEVVLPPDLPVQSAVLCDLVKSLDWNIAKSEIQGPSVQPKCPAKTKEPLWAYSTP